MKLINRDWGFNPIPNYLKVIYFENFSKINSQKEKEININFE